jgi:hypothetical protein
MNDLISNPILIYVIVFISQILLTTIRIIDIKSTYDNQMNFSVIIGMIGACIWFLSTALGMSRIIINGDFWIILIFVISAGLGRYVGFYIDKKIKNIKVKKKNLFHTILFRRF